MVCRDRYILEEPEQFIVESLSPGQSPLAEAKPREEESDDLRVRKRHPAVGMSL